MQNTYAHAKFQRMIQQFLSPSLIIESVKTKSFISFCYNETYKIFLLGDDEGYVRYQFYWILICGFLSSVFWLLSLCV